MKTIFFTLALVLTGIQAMATSLHPCTPRVRAMPTHMHCTDGIGHYAIDIETLMSPTLVMCQGTNRFEVKSATVRTVVGGTQLPTLHLNHGDFTSGANWFKAPKYKLNLKDCAVPQHGGFSVGN